MADRFRWIVGIKFTLDKNEERFTSYELIEHLSGYTVTVDSDGVTYSLCLISLKHNYWGVSTFVENVVFAINNLTYHTISVEEISIKKLDREI